MKGIFSTIGLFTLFYFLIVATLYYLGKFFPFTPSFLNSEYLIPVTFLYLALFFGFKYYIGKKEKP